MSIIFACAALTADMPVAGIPQLTPGGHCLLCRGRYTRTATAWRSLWALRAAYKSTQHNTRFHVYPYSIVKALPDRITLHGRKC